METKPQTEQSRNAIVFIDGNNFYHNIKKMNIYPSDIDFLKLCNFVCNHFKFKRKKTIYYNSVPDISDGKDMYYGHMRFLSSLEDLPHFEVKVRKLQKNSTAEILKEKKEKLSMLDLCNKCKPVVEANCSDCIGNFKKREKGIDVMLAVDMVEHAIKNKCDCCILISGDGDFVPAMDLVRNNKKQVFSASMPNGYSSKLREKYKFLVLSRGLLKKYCFR